MRTLTSRAITTATAAVFALTIMGLQPAAAHDRRGDAAALAAFATIFGTVAAIIAAERYRDRYERRYVYGPVGRGSDFLPRGHRHHRHHW
jgi:hypothetical protein